jgi:hypothetical protein
MSLIQSYTVNRNVNLSTAVASTVERIYAGTPGTKLLIFDFTLFVNRQVSGMSTVSLNTLQNLTGLNLGFIQVQNNITDSVAHLVTDYPVHSQSFHFPIPAQLPSGSDLFWQVSSSGNVGAQKASVVLSGIVVPDTFLAFQGVTLTDFVDIGP